METNHPVKRTGRILAPLGMFLGVLASAALYVWLWILIIVHFFSHWLDWIQHGDWMCNNTIVASSIKTCTFGTTIHHTYFSPGVHNYFGTIIGIIFAIITTVLIISGLAKEFNW